MWLEVFSMQHPFEPSGLLHNGNILVLVDKDQQHILARPRSAIRPPSTAIAVQHSRADSGLQNAGGTWRPDSRGAAGFFWGGGSHGSLGWSGGAQSGASGNDPPVSGEPPRKQLPAVAPEQQGAFGLQPEAPKLLPAAV